MRSSRFSFAALLLALTLASTVAAPIAFAMPRDGRRDDPPFVRVVRLILKRFGITINEEPGGPHP